MSDQTQTEVRVRRAPKFGAFIAVGAVVGALVTLVLTSLFPVDPSVGFVALFAYFCIFGVPAGVALGAVLALILDRRSSKRSKLVEAEREAVDAPEQVAPDSTPTQD